MACRVLAASDRNRRFKQVNILPAKVLDLDWSHGSVGRDDSRTVNVLPIGVADRCLEQTGLLLLVCFQGLNIFSVTTRLVCASSSPAVSKGIFYAREQNVGAPNFQSLSENRAS